MESHFLESFVAVIKHGSIAGAARQLDLTPAAITLRLKALENEFGAPLVQRSGRTVVSTEAGARVFARAQTVLRDIADLKSLATSTCMTGQLRLGVIASAASGLLPGVLGYFNEQHPNTRILIQRGVSSVLYRAVCDEELDAALVVEPQFGIPKTCEWQRLNDEPLILLASSALRVDDVHETLAREPLIRYDHSHWGGKIADDYLRLAGIEPIERYELDALDSVAALVEKGLGVSLVPNWAGPWIQGRALTRHSLPVEGFSRQVGLLWNRSSIRARQIQSLLEATQRALADD
ncbi:MAG: LysR family transcriptional regulator [Pseudomonas sp.]|uniref:LysR family transcriptional regulator n=1 Tax=Pseudomonas sp. TaxID=306 RepID=UPI003D6FA57A